MDELGAQRDFLIERCGAECGGVAISDADFVGFRCSPEESEACLVASETPVHIRGALQSHLAKAALEKATE